MEQLGLKQHHMGCGQQRLDFLCQVPIVLMEYYGEEIPQILIMLKVNVSVCIRYVDFFLNLNFNGLKKHSVLDTHKLIILSKRQLNRHYKTF